MRGSILAVDESKTKSIETKLKIYFDIWWYLKNKFVLISRLIIIYIVTYYLTNVKIGLNLMCLKWFDKFTLAVVNHNFAVNDNKWSTSWFARAPLRFIGVGNYAKQRRRPASASNESSSRRERLDIMTKILDEMTQEVQSRMRYRRKLFYFV